MSYARFGPESDVYVLQQTDYKYYCFWCNSGKHHVEDTPEAMIVHLEQDKKAGKKVPDYVFDNLREDIGVCAQDYALFEEIAAHNEMVQQAKG